MHSNEDRIRFIQQHSAFNRSTMEITEDWEIYKKYNYKCNCDYNCKSYIVREEDDIDKYLRVKYASDNNHTKKIKKAGIFIYDVNGNILLVESFHSKIGIPKGGVKEFKDRIETTKECAERETLEEVGLMVKLPDNPQFNNFYLNDNRTVVTVYYHQVNDIWKEYLDLSQIDKSYNNDSTRLCIFNYKCLLANITSNRNFQNKLTYILRLILNKKKILRLFSKFRE